MRGGVSPASGMPAAPTAASVAVSAVTMVWPSDNWMLSDWATKKHATASYNAVPF